MPNFDLARWQDEHEREWTFEQKETPEVSKREKKTQPLQPISGRYRNTQSERYEACAKADHPAIYLNCSLSTAEVEVMRCHCGKREERIPRSRK